MAQVSMYATGVCPYCRMAERLLIQKGVTSIEKIRIDVDSQAFVEMLEETGRRTVPQIFINGTHIGGYDDLAELDHRGQLDELLKTSPSNVS